MNRFIRCQNHTPFAESFSAQLANPPNPTGIPALYPCLKTIARELAYVPAQLSRNPSATALLAFYRGKAKTPKIIEVNPAVTWKRVWRNIRTKGLTSSEKSTYYLLVNGKIPHAALLFRQNRVNSDQCDHCHQAVEDLEHKLTQCSRVVHLWNFLRPKLELILNQRVVYKNFALPELNNTRVEARRKALKMFINYVNFVIDASNVFTVDALEFILNCNRL